MYYQRVRSAEAHTNEVTTKILPVILTDLVYVHMEPP